MSYEQYPKFIAFCTAQRKFEGGGGGVNNPANLRCPDGQMQSWNRLAQGSVDNFCMFPTPQIGVQAHQNEIYSICIGNSPTYNEGAIALGLKDSSELTIGQMISIYAPVKDNNDPVHYAQILCQLANLNVTDTMKSLLDTSPSPIIQKPILQVPPVTLNSPLVHPSVQEDWWVKLWQWLASLAS